MPADYYPLLARAVAGLDKNTGDNRRALYERARAALVAQLRGVTPVFEESDVTRERLALEEAIRKVEGESWRQATRPPAAAGDGTRRPLDSDEAYLTLEDITEPVMTRRESEAPQTEWRATAAALARESMRNADADAKADFEQRQSRIIRAKLAEVASPAPSLAPDGRLDAGPNALYDTPAADDDLPTLPIRLRAIIQTILAGLPGNAPKQLRSALEGYDEELLARGAQPILGLLQDMAAIIEADARSPDASRDWLQEGMREAFNLFAANHASFVMLFPLDPEREELYANTVVDEGKASGKALSAPFEGVAEATRGANQAGLTTDDFLKIIDKLAEFARVTSTQPTSSHVVQSENKTPARPASSVSAKKRVLLSGLGLFERIYNLLASTAKLAETEAGKWLLAKLGEAISALANLIGLAG